MATSIICFIMYDLPVTMLASSFTGMSLSVPLAWTSLQTLAQQGTCLDIPGHQVQPHPSSVPDWHQQFPIGLFWWQGHHHPNKFIFNITEICLFKVTCVSKFHTRSRKVLSMPWIVCAKILVGVFQKIMRALSKMTTAGLQITAPFYFF